jgi:hypothetical protein
LLKFLKPNPLAFKSFNLLLIPSTISLVVLCSKYPTTSENHARLRPGVSICGIGEGCCEALDRYQEMEATGVLKNAVLVFGQMNEPLGERF